MDKDHMDRVRGIFPSAPHVKNLGIRLVDLGSGWCEAELDIEEKHSQHHGLVHAGVQATLADHTAGGAGSTVITSDKHVLSVEFKINLLRPAITPKLRCRAEELKAGKKIIVVEAYVYGLLNDEEKLTSKATVTLAVVENQTT